MRLVEDQRLVLKVATLYYQEELTQSEIAKKIGVSRPVISKLLQTARDKGIVEIYIKDENAVAVNLGVQLEKKFQLEDVVVVPVHNNQSSEKTRIELARMAASFLTKRLPFVSSIGVSWGTTLADVIDEMPFLSHPNVKVVPLVGGVSGKHLDFDTNHLVFRLSEKLSSTCRYFYAPALAESKELASVLKGSELVNDAMTEAQSVDLALIGVGNPSKKSTWERLGYIDNQLLPEIKETTVVGDAVASLYNRDGNTVRNDMTDRMLGLTVEMLSSIPKVAIVASGKEKAESIFPLIENKRATILIIDQGIAEYLLKMKP